MEKITSINNSYIKSLIQLKTKKNRDEKGLFLVEGYHLVDEAYKAKKLECILVVNEDDYNKYDGIKKVLITKQIIEKLSSTVTPQSVMGVCHGGYLSEISGMRFLLLDNIQDPGNLGTIIRSALGFKIDQIVLSPTCCDAYNDKVIRSTQGGIFRVDLVKMELIDAINELKKNSVLIIGTSLTGKNLNETLNVRKYAIVLGNEANGVSQKVQDACDLNVLIKTEPTLESLNVGVAASIMMYELYKTIDK